MFGDKKEFQYIIYFINCFEVLTSNIINKKLKSCIKVLLNVFCHWNFIRLVVHLFLILICKLKEKNGEWVKIGYITFKYQ